jgi:hypothetical protein
MPPTVTRPLPTLTMLVLGPELAGADARVEDEDEDELDEDELEEEEEEEDDLEEELERCRWASA